MKTFHVKIHGVRPLLHNRYPMPTMANVGTKRRKSTVFDPIAQAKECLYINVEGKIYQPAEHIEGALIKGAAQIKFQGKKSFKDIAAQSLLVMPREIALPQEYRVDLTTCVIPATRGRVPVARPAWDVWNLEFDIRYESGSSDIDDMNANTLENILSEAGKIGIGTFRLKYGKFVVDSVEEVKK